MVSAAGPSIDTEVGELLLLLTRLLRLAARLPMAEAGPRDESREVVRERARE
jgi:hypothetical protein